MEGVDCNCMTITARAAGVVFHPFVLATSPCTITSQYLRYGLLMGVNRSLWCIMRRTRSYCPEALLAVALKDLTSRFNLSKDYSAPPVPCSMLLLSIPRSAGLPKATLRAVLN